jgi:hypothetical protein
MLWMLERRLDLRNLFDATVWAIATCGFWGLMRFGDCTVQEQKDFNGSLHAKRGDTVLLRDSRGRLYAHIWLPSAKMAELGQTQDISLLAQRSFCLIKALWNLAAVSPAKDTDHLFSWNDVRGTAHCPRRAAILKRINGILEGEGFGTMFGHSFRIRGAMFLLPSGVDLEVVRLAGRWCSMAYKAYIRAFKSMVTHNIGFLEDQEAPKPPFVGWAGGAVPEPQ